MNNNEFMERHMFILSAIAGIAAFKGALLGSLFGNMVTPKGADKGPPQKPGHGRRGFDRHRPSLPTLRPVLQDGHRQYLPAVSEIHQPYRPSHGLLPLSR
jgi:hypothetical protein